MKTECAVKLFGPPDSGNTMVVRSLTSHRHMAVIGTGNLLEQEVRLGTHSGRQIDSYKAVGNLGPTNIVKDVVLGGLEQVRGESVLATAVQRLAGRRLVRDVGRFTISTRIPHDPPASVMCASTNSFSERIIGRKSSGSAFVLTSLKPCQRTAATHYVSNTQRMRQSKGNADDHF